MDVISPRKSNIFLTGYISIVLLDLVFGSMELHGLRLLSKPMILISLILYFVYNGKRLPKKTFIYTLLALCFSLMGDVLLLFDERSAPFFMFGLIAFLLAHISYTLVFIQQGHKGVAKRFWWVLAALILYGLTLYLILIDYLGALQIPVIIYISAILLMAITAYNRNGNVRNPSFILVLIGALFFIVSDSLLAVNKFLFAVPASHIWVMGTYATAQYLIIDGLLRSRDPKMSIL